MPWRQPRSQTSDEVNGNELESASALISSQQSSRLERAKAGELGDLGGAGV